MLVISKSALCFSRSSDFEITHIITPWIVLHLVQLLLLFYIVLTFSILISQEPPAYFENTCNSVDKHDYSVICYPIISADYTARSAHG